MIRIKEVVVVEGKEDVRAVKSAVEAEIICTSGLGLTKETLKIIEEAQKRCGVIILTDPDYPGEKIRNMVNQTVPGCKNAYLSKEKARNIKKREIGIEHAHPVDILNALTNAKAEVKDSVDIFSINDLMNWGLVGGMQANMKRKFLGDSLGIGETNGKQFLNRLNGYGITKEEVINLLGKIGKAVDNDE